MFILLRLNTSGSVCKLHRIWIELQATLPKSYVSFSTLKINAYQIHYAGQGFSCPPLQDLLLTINCKKWEKKHGNINIAEFYVTEWMTQFTSCMFTCLSGVFVFHFKVSLLVFRTQLYKKECTSECAVSKKKNAFSL